MSSIKQIEANRRNALKSTGPTSAAGKAASSMNAIKTGLHAKSLVIRGEKLRDLEALIQENYDRHRPATTELRGLVDDLILCEWSLRRLSVIEAEMWEYESEDRYARQQPDYPKGKAACLAYKSFGAMQRRLDSIRRSRDRALAALEHHTLHPLPLQPQPETQPAQPESPHDAPPAPAAAPHAQPATPPPPTLTPQIGFVLSSTQSPANFQPAGDSGEPPR